MRSQGNAVTSTGTCPSTAGHPLSPVPQRPGHLHHPPPRDRETGREHAVCQSPVSAPRFSGLRSDGRQRLGVSVLESSRWILRLFQLPARGKLTFFHWCLGKWVRTRVLGWISANRGSQACGDEQVIREISTQSPEPLRQSQELPRFHGVVGREPNQRRRLTQN